MRTLRVTILATTAAALIAAVVARWQFPDTLILLPSRAPVRAPLELDPFATPTSGAATTVAAMVPEPEPQPVLSAGEFVARMGDAVSQDEFGNYRVEVSTPGFPSREYLVSSLPIYYPHESMLAMPNQIQGCPLGGYYIEQGALGSLLILSRGTARIFHYRCELDATDSGYVLHRLSENASLTPSLNRLLSKGA